MPAYRMRQSKTCHRVVQPKSAPLALHCWTTRACMSRGKVIYGLRAIGRLLTGMTSDKYGLFLC